MNNKIIYPDKITLARLMTPIIELEEHRGVHLYLKADDLTGYALSGNKVRKLEYLLAEALERGATDVITCGGVQSNHARPWPRGGSA
jgi:D-cysteine desulfhydrase